MNARIVLRSCSDRRGLGDEVIGREIEVEVEDVGPVTARERPEVASERTLSTRSMRAR